MRGRTGLLIAVLGTLLLAFAPIAGAKKPPGSGNGNSDAAHKCQHGGYRSLVGSDGTTFRNTGKCVSFAAHGGTFATGLVVPAGQVATFSNPRIGPLGACDTDTWGYQLNLGPNVDVATTSGLCPAPGTAVGSGLTIGPFATATLLRVFLHDETCDKTSWSDELPGGAVIGSNPWTVALQDFNGCFDPSTPSSLTVANFLVDVTIP